MAVLLQRNSTKVWQTTRQQQTLVCDSRTQTTESLAANKLTIAMGQAKTLTKLFTTFVHAEQSFLLDSRGLLEKQFFLLKKFYEFLNQYKSSRTRTKYSCFILFENVLDIKIKKARLGLSLNLFRQQTKSCFNLFQQNIHNKYVLFALKNVSTSFFLHQTLQLCTKLQNNGDPEA